MSLEGKRLLILGGTNCADEIAQFAKANGVVLVATGKYPDTLLKRISSESYYVDAVDDAALAALIREKQIDGVFAGFNEDVVPHALHAAALCGLPVYCTVRQWDDCADKSLFKQMCRRSGVPVTDEFTLTDVDLGTVPYPLAVKPADSCGSRGFAVCKNADEVHSAVGRALPFSRTGRVLIERFMPYDAVIIHYTLSGGRAYFSGMSEKRSQRLEGDGSSVMAFQRFPSAFVNAYIDTLDSRVRAMFAAEGMTEGSLWIEAFCDNGRFWFNEMGYRFGGSMTQHPVRWYCGIRQLDMLLTHCLGGEAAEITPHSAPNGFYYILPLHLHAGVIARIAGENDVRAEEGVYAYVPIHGVGDVIRKSGTVDQVFCYLHITAADDRTFSQTVNRIMNVLSVTDGDGASMLFCMIDVNRI